ncbi:hypothetical protein Esti_000621 [Eimeria stiedai]
MGPFCKPAPLFEGSYALQLALPRALLKPTSCTSGHKAEACSRVSLRADPGVYSGGAGQGSKGTTEPSLPRLEAGRQTPVPPPESTEAVQTALPPSIALDPEAAMKELAAAARSLATAVQLSSNAAVPPEAHESLTALRYLSLPQLDTQAMEIPCKIIFAEMSTPGEKRVQVKGVAASITRFVGETDHVAIFEVQATDPLLASLLQGPHHLRLGYSPLNRTQVFNNPTAILDAALEAAKPMKASLNVLEKCMEHGFASASEASELTALLLPIYVAEIPRFDQKFAWVGGKVFAPVATLSPAFACALDDLMRSPASSVSSAESLFSQVSMQAPHLSVAAREFAAFRVLTAVCKLHSLGIVHGDLKLRSIVVTLEGNVFFSALESARLVPLNKSCSPSISAAINTAGSLQAGRFSNAKKLVPSKVPAPAGGLSAAVQPTPSSNDASTECLTDSEQQLAYESVRLGVVLFQILSGGGLPFDMTEGGDVEESIKALQQGLFQPYEVNSRAAMELQKLGVDERWQACLLALLSLQQRHTAMQAAATYFPQALPPGNPPDTEARG